MEQATVPDLQRCGGQHRTLDRTAGNAQAAVSALLHGLGQASDWPQHQHPPPNAGVAWVSPRSTRQCDKAGHLRARPQSAMARLSSTHSTASLAWRALASKARPATAAVRVGKARGAADSHSIARAGAGAFRWRRSRSPHDPARLPRPMTAGSAPARRRHGSAALDADARLPAAAIRSRPDSTATEGHAQGHPKDGSPTPEQMVRSDGHHCAGMSAQPQCLLFAPLDPVMDPCCHDDCGTWRGRTPLRALMPCPAPDACARAVRLEAPPGHNSQRVEGDVGAGPRAVAAAPRERARRRAWPAHAARPVRLVIPFIAGCDGHFDALRLCQTCRACARRLFVDLC
jgi:hypothetical protein